MDHLVFSVVIVLVGIGGLLAAAYGEAEKVRKLVERQLELHEQCFEELKKREVVE